MHCCRPPHELCDIVVGLKWDFIYISSRLPLPAWHVWVKFAIWWLCMTLLLTFFWFCICFVCMAWCVYLSLSCSPLTTLNLINTSILKPSLFWLSLLFSLFSTNFSIFLLHSFPLNLFSPFSLHLSSFCTTFLICATSSPPASHTCVIIELPS